MRKRMVSLLCTLALCLALGAITMTAAALADKSDYDPADPRFVNLNFDSAADDDGNFAYMAEGAVVLRSGTMAASADGLTYTLQDPDETAKAIRAGTPVAWVGTDTAYFFVPRQVTEQEGSLVFTCAPEETTAAQLFQDFCLNMDRMIEIEEASLRSADGSASATLSGTLHLELSYTPGALEGEIVFKDVSPKELSLDADGAMDGTLELGCCSVDMGPVLVNLPVSIDVSTRGPAEMAMNLVGNAAWSMKASADGFSESSAEGSTCTGTVTNLAADGGFSAALNMGVDVQLFSHVNVGFLVTDDFQIDAALSGDEHWEDGTWHTCRAYGCLEGTITQDVTIQGRLRLDGASWEQPYSLAHSSSPFHSSYSYYDEFALAPCGHLLYPVEVTVVDSNDAPLAGVSLRYDPVPDLGSTSAYGVNEAVTDEDGHAVLYLPLDTACTISAEATRTEGVARASCSFTAAEGNLACTMTIPTTNLVSVTFAPNAQGYVENMPDVIAVVGGTEGIVPNDVPRCEGKVFVRWDTKADGVGTRYLPGDRIAVGTAPIILYAIWTNDQPKVDFRTITYDPNGNNVSLPDNPQIYYKDAEGFTLRNPTRADYIFLGWTCGEIDLDEPTKNVTVRCEDTSTYHDFVNRTYVANWEPVTYTVAWKNDDGTVLAVSRDLARDEEPEYTGTTPTKQADEMYFYRFSGWTPEISAVTGDTSYTAQFRSYSRLHVTGPEAAAALTGEAVSFQVTASGGEGTLTYQWYVLPADGVGALIDGADAAQLTLTAAAALDGNRYYCVVTDEIGQAVSSDQATLTVSTPAAPATAYPIELRLGDHGDVRLSRRWAQANETVTFVVEPETGYQLDSLTVTDSKGSELALTDEGGGKYSFKMPARRVVVEAVFTVILPDYAACDHGPDCPLYGFTDLNGNAWYHDGIHFCLEEGVMAGYGNDLFGPDDALSRAQLCQIVYNMESQPAVTGGSAFTDVADGAWYLDAVTWAASQGIVGGYGGGLFGPEDNITREQLATILYRYAQAKGYDVSVGEDTNILSYTDVNDLAEYAIPAMQWACGAGVINGTGDGSTLTPQGNATRAQIATMLMRFCEEYVTW